MIETSSSEIAGPLLAFLRTELGDCDYAEAPTPMVGGNETRVFALRLEGLPAPLDRELVLRLFRPGDDPIRAKTEAAFQNAIAGQGFPAAPAHAVCGQEELLGAPFFVMERIPGGPLFGKSLRLDQTGTPELRIGGIVSEGLRMLIDLPRILAEVDVRIHELDVAMLIADLEASGSPWRHRTPRSLLEEMSKLVEEYSLDSLRTALDWMQEHVPDDSGITFVCHGDMQPLNLIGSGARVSGVVDWSNVLLAPAECEIGWTRATFRSVPIPLPGPLSLAERRITSSIANRYQRAYERHRPLDAEAVRYYEAFHSLLVLVSLAEQRARGVFVRDAWSTQKGWRMLESHFESVTGRAIPH